MNQTLKDLAYEALNSIPDQPMDSKETEQLFFTYSMFKKDIPFRHYIIACSLLFSGAVAKDKYKRLLEKLSQVAKEMENEQ